jgi:hypothetical protein
MPIEVAYGENSLSTGVRYDAFQDDRSPKTDGFEITIPFGITYGWGNLFLSVETAYSHANVAPGASSDANISSVTDTLISASYMFPDLPVGIVAGIDVNVPTGKEQLDAEQRRVEFGENHDLFAVDDFGKGMNVGMSLGVIKEFETLQMGINGAYIFNGQWDPTTDISDDDFDPGDQLLVLALINWQVSSRLTLVSSVTYSRFTADTVDGREDFREGDSLIFGSDLQIDLAPFEVVFSLQDTIQAKNEELAGDKLETEPQNSNGNTLFSLIEITYASSLKLRPQFVGDLRYYGESDRKHEVSGLPYTGRRTRYAVGPGLLYTLSDNLSCHGEVQYVWMKQNRDTTLDQVTTFQGVNLSIGATYTF